jgi:uncharacterized membrane protein
MKSQKVTLKKDGSVFYGKKEARFLKRKAERKEEKIEKERLKNEKNTQCSWWHWVFLVIFLLITGGMLVKKSSLISLIALISLISLFGSVDGEKAVVQVIVIFKSISFDPHGCDFPIIDILP